MNKLTNAHAIRIASLYQHLTGNLIATIATSLLLAFYLSEIAEVSFAKHWLFAIVSVTLLRIPLFRIYRRLMKQQISAEKAAAAFGVGALFAGLCWGGAFLVVPVNITLATTYVAITVACVMALTCNTYQASSSAVIAFNLPIVCIVVSRFAFSEQGKILAIGVLIYGALLTFNALQTARRIQREIELQLNNAILIEDLAEQKTKSENLNFELETKVQQRTQSLNGLNNELREEIIERQHVEDELLASEARFRSLYHEHPSILLTVDSSGFVTNINDYGANYLGYTHSTILRKKFSELSTAAAEVNVLLSTILGKESLSEARGRLELVKATGEIITTQVTARKVVSTAYEPDRILVVCEDVTEIDLLQQKLAYHASRDTLTALYNRREFETRFSQLFERTKRHGGEHVLCFIDLDRFKLINDTSGHIAGDEILKSISEAMKTCMRQTDVLARLGGDEFAIIMEETSLEDAKQIIERLRSEIENIECVWDGVHHQISACFGLAELGPKTESMDDVMRDADAACYLAKTSGRNCIRTVDANNSKLHRSASERGCSSKLNDAVEQGRLFLALQPVVNSNTGVTDQYEALLRIDDDAGGFSDAHLLVSAAERFGLIKNIDKWVFETALEMLEKDNRFSSDEQISLNVSAVSITDDNFTEDICAMLRKRRHLAPRICVEIREVDILRSGEVISKFLGEINRFGVKVIIDDFGTSFAGFKYLEKLSVDFVKLDPVLIEGLDRNQFSQEILSAIIELTRRTEVTMIAKGVSNDRLAERLNILGIERMQGFAIGIPSNVLSNSVASLQATG